MVSEEPVAAVAARYPTVAYLGCRSDHRAGFARLVSTAGGGGAVCLDDSLAAGLYHRPGRFGRLLGRAARLVAQFRGRTNRDHLDRLTAQLDAAGPSASWRSGVRTPWPTWSR